MQINKLILGSGIATIVAVAGLATSALACHPEGAIIKKVQNVTTGSALSDANSTAQAITAKPGDTLKYVISITNNGAAKSNGDDDMAKTVMTDTLPIGVSLVSNPSERSITETIGTVKPGQTVTKEYLVTVTAASQSTITNTACYTGTSIVNDNPQKGCDTAVVQVTVPPVVTPPVTTTTPTTPVTTTSVDTTPVVETTPVELPHTGPTETILGTTLAIGAAYFAVHQYIVSRRQLSSALRTQR
jgi:uncharacterized repeat protein (TIGR01451 family)